MRYFIYMGIKDTDTEFKEEWTMPEYWNDLKDARKWLSETMKLYKGRQGINKMFVKDGE